jgi:non-canonical (house-cleaning) NTP pyrophosphatase
METSMHIILGSASPHKLEAVREACKILGLQGEVSGRKTSSGQPEQPVGFEETFSGALTRAIFAKEQDPASIAIGIESGIFRFGKTTPLTLDISVIVLIDHDGRRIVSTSEGMQLPEEYVRIAEERGFERVTVGSVIAEHLGGDPADPHSILSKGKISRAMTLIDALVIALRQTA